LGCIVKKKKKSWLGTFFFWSYGWWLKDLICSTLSFTNSI
jgi:hypothetical protein